MKIVVLCSQCHNEYEEEEEIVDDDIKKPICPACKEDEQFFDECF